MVGVDYEPDAIEKATSHFPDVEFIRSGWDEYLDTSEEKFDVILFASAIHYAEDQEKILEKAIGLLTEDGVLILECGIGATDDPTVSFITHERWDGPKKYFTKGHLRSTVRKLNFELFYDGDSVKQMGDAIDRRVFHIRRRRQSIIFNFDPPGNGKSGMGSLLVAAGVYKRLDDLASDTIKAQPNSAFVVGAEQDIAKFWARLVDLSMHDWAANRIFEFVTSSTAELTYVEGWVPDQVIEQLDHLFAGTNFITFRMSRSDGYIPPTGRNPVAATHSNDETWFTTPIADACVDYVHGVRAENTFIMTAVGWHDIAVPHDQYCLIVGGNRFSGELLHRPNRGDLGPNRIPFVVSFKMPIELQQSRAVEAGARMYAVGAHRELFELPAKQALRDVRIA